MPLSEWGPERAGPLAPAPARRPSALRPVRRTVPANSKAAPCEPPELASAYSSRINADGGRGGPSATERSAEGDPTGRGLTPGQYPPVATVAMVR
jgi:hypothetical protein